MRSMVAVVAALLLPVAFTQSAGAEPAIERGRYLVEIMLCADCHSPQTEEGPNLSLALTGGLGFEVPGLGIFWAPNLTPAATGLGGWSEEEIVTALRTGIRSDGRVLAPIMPYRFFASLTDEDASAIARYLQSVPPVENAVPEPVEPGGAANAPYLTMVVPSTPPSGG